MDDGLTQYGLFDGDNVQKLRRNDDPDTSKAAAATIFEKLPARRKQAYLAAKELGEASTGNEIAAKAVEMFGGMQDSYRRRCSELVEHGWFATGPKRKCTVSGQTLTTYLLIN